MDGLTLNQRYHLILADIAMAAAIRVHDGGCAALQSGQTYGPGCIRDGWLAQATDETLRKRVTAMASAGVGSLQGLLGPALAAAAEAYGIPLEEAVAEDMAAHFQSKREAVLTYRR